MEKYDPSWSPNEGDSALRYAFQNQPDVSAWNCERLAEAFSSIIGEGARHSPFVPRNLHSVLILLSSTLSGYTYIPMRSRTSYQANGMCYLFGNTTVHGTPNATLEFLVFALGRI